MKKRHKHYLMGFLLGFLAATCLMVHAIYTRNLEPNFTRLFVFPVLMGVLIALAAWHSKAWDLRSRRLREEFRRRGWNLTAYRITALALAVLLACALTIGDFWNR
ncbi:DUF3180 family protein [Labrenzia sp. 5N]|uniref:DUF3180 family protein n=1 Tax=Labrenzia sp. 5N TaxID=2723402 RepID=UPI0014485D81|nr:DUF3180 family protein [Labrenzia sp. 5N]NKX67028.1 DUF3180 family protein [Labrenzia sp. 5N]